MPLSGTLLLLALAARESLGNDGCCCNAGSGWKGHGEVRCNLCFESVIQLFPPSQTYYWVTSSVSGWDADNECNKTNGGHLAEVMNKETLDFFVNDLHPDHNRKCRRFDPLEM